MAQEKARAARTRKKTSDGEAMAKPARRARKLKQVAPDVVAVHAYLLWERGEPGDATEHWLRAERELAA